MAETKKVLYGRDIRAALAEKADKEAASPAAGDAAPAVIELTEKKG